MFISDSTNIYLQDIVKNIDSKFLCFMLSTQIWEMMGEGLGIWEGSQEQGTPMGFCLHGVKVNFIWFRSGDPIQSYLRLKTAYFICFWQVYILLSYKVNERKSGYNENYKRKIPQKSLCVGFFFLLWCFDLKKKHLDSEFS